MDYLDFDYEDEVADYEDDKSERSDDIISDTSSENDEEKEEVEEEEAGIEEEVRQANNKVSNDRIRRYGSDRTTMFKLDKFERTNAIIFMAKQIEKGAKVPKIVKDSDKINDTIVLAYKSVMTTVRKSIDDVKSPEDIKNGASIIIKRDVGSKYIDIWPLHELIYFEAGCNMEEEIKEATDKFLIDSSKINIGDWLDL